MFHNYIESLNCMPLDTQSAARHMIISLSQQLLPSIEELNNKIKNESDQDNIYAKNYRSTFLVCCNQISETVIWMVKLFKSELKCSAVYKNQREFLLHRLLFWAQKLSELYDAIDKSNESSENSIFENRILFGHSFIQWLDDVFDLLGDLANTFSNDVDFEKLDKITEEHWRKECKDEVRVLCGAISEMLLGAMTVKQGCKLEDQNIIKVRCQVVLRESRSLLFEMLDENDVKLDKIGDVKLKSSLHFASVKIAMDVLKESLYALERSVNNAILALILECFMLPRQTIQGLMNHARDGNHDEFCKNADETQKDDVDCEFVKQCDLLYDRIVEIGWFAATCSTDDKKVLPLKSSLAGLEGLESHLIPEILSAPDHRHATMLVNIWAKEVSTIIEMVYLIVDPVPMIELSCETMLKNIALIQQSNKMDATVVKSVIRIGQTCAQFCQTYLEKEAIALGDIQILRPLLDNLEKANNELESFWFATEKGANHTSYTQLIKRLKLVYTQVKRILTSVAGIDKEDQFSDEDFHERSTFASQRNHIRSGTYVADIDKLLKQETSNALNSGTFIKRQKNTVAVDKQVFIRSLSTRLENVRSGRLKLCADPIEIDSVLEVGAKRTISIDNEYPTPFKRVNKMSLYSFGAGHSKKEISLREQLFKNKLGSWNYSKTTSLPHSVDCSKSNSDTSMNLQITEILDQLTDLSSTLSSLRRQPSTLSKNYKKSKLYPVSVVNIDFESDNIQNTNTVNTNVVGEMLNLTVNCGDVAAKNSWSIEIKSEECVPSLNSAADQTKPTFSLSDVGIDVSFGSEVDTPQRMNDLIFLEDKLAALKQMGNKS